MRYPCCKQPERFAPLAATLITTCRDANAVQRLCNAGPVPARGHLRRAPARGQAGGAAEAPWRPGGAKAGRSRAEWRGIGRVAFGRLRRRAMRLPFPGASNLHGSGSGRGYTTISFFNEMYDGDAVRPGLWSGHGLGAQDAARGDRPEEGRGRGAVPPHRHHLRGLWRGRRPRAADPVRHDAAGVRRARMAQAGARHQAARAGAERVSLRRLSPRRDHPRRA